MKSCLLHLPRHYPLSYCSGNVPVVLNASDPDYLLMRSSRVRGELKTSVSTTGCGYFLDFLLENSLRELLRMRWIGGFRAFHQHHLHPGIHLETLIPLWRTLSLSLPNLVFAEVGVYLQGMIECRGRFGSTHVFDPDAINCRVSPLFRRLFPGGSRSQLAQLPRLLEELWRSDRQLGLLNDSSREVWK
ncbi:unnamed protein product [Pleuronectes platessa]|uniref:Uncharacterized protein n=1 Tax=Pleuronectes platessa TaxID=8262 RepID=A0A9N7UDE4_PLEPL|nr:unnamed protein product [Pleuronectes platessa]